MRVAAAMVSLAALSGCELFNDEDPRVGVEGVEACLKRVANKSRSEEFDALDDGALWVPTYTYDVTKLELEAIQQLSVSYNDETSGTRINQTTNETSTAVAQFMQQPVDEDGAFFMGRDPALYRVRGAPVQLSDVITSGCERQLPNMRLIEVEFSRHSAAPPEADGPEEASTEENNS